MRATYFAPIVLSACVSTGGLGLSPATPQPDMRFDAQGIEVVGTGRRIDFGRDRTGVVETVSRLQGSEVSAVHQSDVCGGSRSAIEWRRPNRLVLVFENNGFVGWSLDQDAADQSATGALNAGAQCTLPTQ